jgi:hypothetical protein
MSTTRIFEGNGNLAPILWDVYGGIGGNGEGSFLNGNVIVEEVFYQ